MLAASVAGVPVTTEFLIAEVPKVEEHAHGTPGDGMGEMDRQGAETLATSRRSTSRQRR
jgi:hypothetical protein